MEGWITTTEAASRLRVDRDVVCELIETGRLPAFKIGLVYLVAAADVDAFIEREAVTGTRPRQPG